MAKYRKRPIIVEATQWFQNGDHPDDDCQWIFPEGQDAFLSEGKVVRYFRHPNISDNHPCRHCNNVMKTHGWIDTFDGGKIVCPGDWIVTDRSGGRYPMKSDLFEATHEPIDCDITALDSRI